MSETVRDIAWAGVKVSPPITVAALTLNEWVAAATLFYIVLQSAYLVWKWWRVRSGKMEL